MVLLDVLPQVERLDREDLLGLQVAVGQLLEAYDDVPSEEEIALVTARYRDYLADPESSISVEEALAHLDGLIAA